MMMSDLEFTQEEINALSEHELAQVLQLLRDLEQDIAALSNSKYTSQSRPIINNNSSIPDRQLQEALTTIDSIRKLNAEADATLQARRAHKRARCQAISLLTQPIVPHGVSDLEGWITMYSRPLMQLPSIPPPGMGDLKDMPMHNIIQRLDSFAMSNIVEVNNVPQDHPPNPPAPNDDNEEEEIKPSQSRTTIGRLGEYGHELRPIQILPPSRDRFATLAHKKALRAPALDEQALHFEGGREARWPNPVWTAPARSLREEEDDAEGVGVGGADRARRTKKTKKKKVSFVQGARLDPDVGYRPRYLDQDTMLKDDGEDTGNKVQDGENVGLQGVNGTRAVPIDIEEDPKEEDELPPPIPFSTTEPTHISESEILVAKPPPSCRFQIFVDVVREFMNKHGGLAIAFGYLGQMLTDHNFNCKKFGYKTLKEMISTARGIVGFGWKNPGDTNSSWIWLWDPKNPYRHPNCSNAQWESFRAARDKWEPPGLNEGMINIMRGGVGKVSNRAKTEARAVAAGRTLLTRANTAGPAGMRGSGFDHMRWLNGSQPSARRDEVYAAAASAGMGGTLFGSKTNRIPLGSGGGGGPSGSGGGREAAFSAPPPPRGETGRMANASEWRGVDDIEEGEFERSDAPAILSSNWIPFGARKREPSGESGGGGMARRSRSRSPRASAGDGSGAGVKAESGGDAMDEGEGGPRAKDEDEEEEGRVV
ncbi:hypothetical protein CF326_g8100, partial [Tilletia indica]